MHTNIVIDEELMNDALQATGLKTKKAVVEAGLRKLIRLKQQVDVVKALEGEADWEGDQRSLREDRDVSR